MISITALKSQKTNIDVDFQGGHEEVVYVFGAVTKDAAIMGAFVASFNIGAQCFKT